MKKIILSIVCLFLYVSIQAQIFRDPYCIQITNDSVTITYDSQYHSVYIYVIPASTAAGIIRGSVGKVGGKTTTSLTLPAGTAYNVAEGEKPIYYMRIVAPSGCTILISGYIWRRLI